MATSVIETKLCDGYRVLKELFGPLTAEVMEAKNGEEYKHIWGERIYENVKKIGFTKDEVERLERDNQGLKDSYIFPFILPLHILHSALSGPLNHLVRLEQFVRFSRVLNIQVGNRRFSYIISSRLLEFEPNEDMFNRFCPCLFKYLENEHPIALIPSYIYTLIPAFLRRHSNDLLELLNKLAAQRIENKPVNSGLILVDGYDEFKREFRSDLFWNLESETTLYDLLDSKRCLLEITDGKKGFIIIDKDFNIKGLMYPDLIPKGLQTNYEGGKEFSHDCVIVSINGTESTKAVRQGKLIFEIRNGLIRVRDYSIVSTTLREYLHSIGVVGEYVDDFIKEVIDICTQKKGTILVVGERITPDGYSKGISGSISLRKENGNKEYKYGVLSQLSHTDGAVFIDREFVIYIFGAILKVKPTEGQHESGGSRSYSAQMFSQEHPDHIIIKISEDGPLSLYRDGKKSIEV